MSIEQAWLTFFGGILMALIGLAGGMYTSRLGKRATDQASNVELIGKLLGRIEQLEQGQKDLWALREADARAKRILGDYADALQDHIWKGLPPPPPPRPDGA